MWYNCKHFPVMGVCHTTGWRCFSMQNLLWAQIKQSFKIAFGFHVIFRKALLMLRKWKTTTTKPSPTFSSHVFNYCKAFYVKEKPYIMAKNINEQPNTCKMNTHVVVMVDKQNIAALLPSQKPPVWSFLIKISFPLVGNHYTNFYSISSHAPV